MAVAAMLLMLGGAVAALAQQSATATIEGIVTDPNNAVVVGAKVTARNVDTALTREITTDASGLYRLIALPPGTYALSASATGFAENKYGNVWLDAFSFPGITSTSKISRIFAII